MAGPQQGDLRLSGPLSGQGAGGGPRTRVRRVPADLRADLLAAESPTPLKGVGGRFEWELPTAGPSRFPVWFGLLWTASPQHGDFRLSGPPSGQGAGGGARTRDRKIPADNRANSLATVAPPPPPFPLRNL
ncbi:hypothetical protein PoB_004481800 [Plakobranchus ocellatus]|uniref:Uncharacterized protein n=1 Tax=Plakobranchus ocellatus TaxID=259542 RepID=A0AAV4BHL0_9GAST|nr:hypothetical protein PoB_004481800 [Plakobranchus ocellatus]